MEIGTKFRMSKDAIDNYGEKHKGKIYTIENRYHGTNEHSGYDPSGGYWIYDIEGLNFSLYKWEMLRIH